MTRAELEKRVAELEAEKAATEAARIVWLESRVIELEDHVKQWRAQAYEQEKLKMQVAHEAEEEIKRVRAIAEGKQAARTNARTNRNAGVRS